MTLDVQHDGQLWRAPDVARLLNVALSTVYLLCETGALPCVRIGRAVRFDPAVIRRWVANGGSTAKNAPALRAPRR